MVERRIGRRAFLQGVAATGGTAVSHSAGAEDLKFFNWDKYLSVERGPAAKSAQALPLRSILAPDFDALQTPNPFVAAIRPYREGGMRVSLDAAVTNDGVERHVIHNYGHGGAGVTLSFSSAETVRGFVERLEKTRFDRKGLPRVAIIGSGVIGLTTARALKIRWPELDLQIMSRDENVTQVTSYLAGGQFALASSLPEYRSDAQQAFLSRHLEASERAIAEFGRGGLQTRYGIARRTSYSLDPDHGANVRLKLGGRVAPANRYESWLIDPTRLLPTLREEMVARGVRFVTRTFATEAEIYGIDAGIIINCMGFGSKSVFADAALEGRRGHLVILKNTRKLDYFLNSWCGDAGLRYLFSRHDDIVIGGTAHKDFDAHAYDAHNGGDVRIIERLLKSARSVFESSGVRCG